MIVPVFPLPEASAVVPPLPSLNPHAPTRPEFGGGGGGGGSAPPTVTILAIEGTPLASMVNSMYTPGGAMSAFAGAVAVNAPAPAVKDSGT